MQVPDKHSNSFCICQIYYVKCWQVPCGRCPPSFTPQNDLLIRVCRLPGATIMHKYLPIDVGLSNFTVLLGLKQPSRRKVLT